MACGGCGRKSPPPMGMTTRTTTVAKKASTQPTTAKMRTTFELLTTDNRTMTFGSLLEAKAEQIRLGGGRIR